jgi:hypothetical protein
LGPATVSKSVKRNPSRNENLLLFKEHVESICEIALRQWWGTLTMS